MDRSHQPQSQSPSPGTPPVRRRAGGRSERVRVQVAEAVLAILREGRGELTVAEIAERAGVHRTTVYRWWPTPADLIREALTVHTARLEAPDTGTWASDVDALAVELAHLFADPVEMAMNATMAAGAHPEVDAVHVAHWSPILRGLARIVDRAKQRGEVAPDTDAAVVLHLLLGPLLLQTVLLRRRPDTSLVGQVARAVTQAFATPPGPPT